MYVYLVDNFSCYKIVMDIFKEGVEISDNIIQPPRLCYVTINIIIWCIIILLWLPVSAVCLPLFVVGVQIWGLPPIISPMSRISTYFMAIFTEGLKSEENIPFSNRIIAFLIVLTNLIKAPINGTCWFLDELLYPAYHKVDIREPIFFITAARSGSTQLANYLENDRDNFITPTSGEGFFPFIWIWKIVVPILKRFAIHKQQHIVGDKMFGSEAKKRHNFSLVKTETWDIIVGTWHFSYLSWYLGIDFMKWGFPFAKLKEPTDEQYLKSFHEFTDSIMKKVVYHRGRSSQHVLIKGHFLIAVNGLQERFPDAKFFTVIREPLDRFQSFMNFLATISADGPPRKDCLLSPVTWKVTCKFVIHTQIPYCEQEMLFYEQSNEKRLAIPFTMYVNNLKDTLQTIYSFCNMQAPILVISNAVTAQNTTHDRRSRKASYNPKFNRALPDLGIDEEKLKGHLIRYSQWIQKLEKELIHTSQ